MPAGSRRVPGLQPSAFEALTLSNTTAAGLSSTALAAGGTLIVFSVKGNAGAHYRDDGTDPTNTTGVWYPQGGDYRLAVPLSAARWCRAGNTTAATVGVSVYKQAGD